MISAGISWRQLSACMLAREHTYPPTFTATSTTSIIMAYSNLSYIMALPAIDEVGLFRLFWNFNFRRFELGTILRRRCLTRDT